MSRRSKQLGPAAEVLPPAVVQHMAAAMAPAELTQADRDAMHDRILRRIRDEAPPGTVTNRSTDMRWVTARPGGDSCADSRAQGALLMIRSEMPPPGFRIA